ncbi:hypothetical protein F4678DRAFT_50163 [Xylaria arbuscula]|nr:hypothetical protein F4678DRAFT_50163 [Xylaria arbuscula]
MPSKPGEMRCWRTSFWRRGREAGAGVHSWLLFLVCSAPFWFPNNILFFPFYFFYTVQRYLHAALIVMDDFLYFRRMPIDRKFT